MGSLNIIVGDITSDEILKDHDLIINPTNPRMVCGMGVSQSIFHKAGVEQLESYTQSKYNISYFHENNLMQVGEIRITPGFKLNMDIMFVQGPKVYEYEEYEMAKNLLIETYRNVIEKAYTNGYKNILIPSLGTGSYGFQHTDVAKDIMGTLRNSLIDKNMNVDFVLYNEIDKSYYEN